MKKIIVLLSLIILVSQNAQYAHGATVPMDTESAMKYNEYYNNGVALFKANKYSSAILEFKKVLRAKPYDLTVKNALVSCYLARAEFFINQGNDPKKAINDFKNALFYMKYWGEEQNQASASLISSAASNLQALETKYGALLTPAQRFENAKTLRTQGELQAAGYDFAQLFSNPTYAQASLENAGDVYKSLNNNFDAINCYRKVIKLDEKNAKVHFKYAMILDEINNTEAAAEEFNLALKYGENNTEILDTLENLWLSRTISNPADAQAYMNLAIILQKKGNFAGAQAQYFKAISLDPQDKTILYNLASMYVEQKNYKEAIGVYNKILTKEPDNKAVIAYKAVAQEKMEDYNGAISSYKSLVALNPNDSYGKNAKGDIARIISQSFNETELLAYLESEAAANPADFNAQYDCAFQAHKIGQFDKAVQYYKKALAINPKHVEGYINLAQLYSNKNDFKAAQEAIDSGLSALPWNKKLVEQKNVLMKEESADMYRVATKYWDEKKYELALETYMKIHIQTPEVLGAIASCYSELNDNEKAIEYYKKVLEKTPNDIDALQGVASAYLDLNKSDESKIYLEKILALNPQNAEARNVLNSLKQSEEARQLNDAIKFYEEKDYLKAMGGFNAITAQYPQNAYVYYYKALIYDEQKKPGDAIAQYKKAISLDPKFSSAIYGLAIALDEMEKYQEAVENYDKYIALRTAEGAKNDTYIDYVKNRSAELKAYLKSAK